MNRQEFGAWIEDLVEEGELDSRKQRIYFTNVNCFRQVANVVD